ncbi:SETMR methyltransferase, partial [Acromyrmex insinuator]
MKVDHTTILRHLSEIGKVHDNARPHTLYKTIAKLNELKYEILQHPAYSPNLSPTDFHFFKHLEQFLWAKHMKMKIV